MGRVLWLDLARAVAIFLVVITHAHENAAIQSVLLKSTLYSFDRIGVPIFIMLSGALVLPRLHGKNIFSFYRKRIPQFLIVLFIFSVLTNWVVSYLATGEILQSLIASVKKYNAFNGDVGGAHQLWYMFIIIQLYLIAPFLSKLLISLKNYEILLFIVICLTLNQFAQTMQMLGYTIQFLNRMRASFTGEYLVYFITGYYIVNRIQLEGFKAINKLILSMSIFIVTILTMIYIDMKHGKVNDNIHWYSSSLLVYISGVSLFVVLNAIYFFKESRFFTFISNAAFGIYLTHYAILYIIKNNFTSMMMSLSEIERVAFLFLLTFIISLVITLIMRRWLITRYLIS